MWEAVLGLPMRALLTPYDAAVTRSHFAGRQHHYTDVRPAEQSLERTLHFLTDKLSFILVLLYQHRN